MKEWISVHDETPKLRKRVLCYCYNKTVGDYYTIISYYFELDNCKGTFMFNCETSSYPDEVVCWQELPGDPEGYE
jgi:hypothetical protein